jgi:hypothetical protein
LDIDRLANGVLVFKQIRRYGWTEHTHWGIPFHIILGECRTQTEVPLANFKVLRAYPAVLRAPIQVSVDGLDAPIYIRSSALYARNLIQNGLSIPHHQRLATAAADANSIARSATGFNPDEVIADIAELRFHTAGTSITDGDNANERPNAHNDAQHCQEAANAVANQRLECFSNYRPQGHE